MFEKVVKELVRVCARLVRMLRGSVGRDCRCMVLGGFVWGWWVG